jgi:hypothetical protein
MSALINAYLTIVIITICAGLYLLPLVIGWIRHIPDTGAVVLVNVLLGWTCIGWIVALAMALRSVPAPAVQVIHQVTRCTATRVPAMDTCPRRERDTRRTPLASDII